MTSKRTVRVAVIGAGSAGLAQIKQLLDAFHRPDVSDRLSLELVAFEKRDDVGGLWNFDPAPKPFVSVAQRQPAKGKEKVYIYPQSDDDPTPLYEGLVATLPGSLMAYRGFTFPEDVPTIPTAAQISDYLKAYAKEYGLYKYIRFETRVERLRLSESGPGWSITSWSPSGGRRTEQFDQVSITNGHYSDPWIPEMSGLSSFPGQVIHSREFRRARDHLGQTVLVVGSFSSGTDIARLLGSLNLNPGPSTRVYQSSSGLPNSSKTDDPDEPWKPYIRQVPLIDHLEPPSSTHPKGRIHFTPGPEPTETIDDVDTIIFATGYYNSLPFCKTADSPWDALSLLDEMITPEQRQGGHEWEIGGQRGLKMDHMDEMLLFLKGDRTIAFPGLPYQIVPFPFAEVQARLVAYLWAGLLPSLPDRLSPPPNRNNPVVSPNNIDADNAPLEAVVAKPLRHSIKCRAEYIFPVPYEWEYSEYVFGLLKDADADAGVEVEDHWRAIEPWRREQRADTGMRKRLLGY